MLVDGDPNIEQRWLLTGIRHEDGDKQRGNVDIQNRAKNILTSWKVNFSWSTVRRLVFPHSQRNSNTLHVAAPHKQRNGDDLANIFRNKLLTSVRGSNIQLGRSSGNPRIIDRVVGYGVSTVIDTNSRANCGISFPTKGRCGSLTARDRCSNRAPTKGRCGSLAAGCGISTPTKGRCGSLNSSSVSRHQ